MKKYPDSLAPLFNSKWSGRMIEYSLDDTLFRSIETECGELPEVGVYRDELVRYLDTGKAKHDGNLTTAAVAHAKSEMVDAVIAKFGHARKDSPKALRARIEELELLLSRKDAALRNAAARCKAAGILLT